MYTYKATTLSNQDGGRPLSWIFKIPDVLTADETWLLEVADDGSAGQLLQSATTNEWSLTTTAADQREARPATPWSSLVECLPVNVGWWGDVLTQTITGHAYCYECCVWWVTFSTRPIPVAHVGPLCANVTSSTNRKYITYCIVVNCEPIHGHRQHAHKISWRLDVRFLRYVSSRETDTQTDGHTRWLQYFAPIPEGEGERSNNTNTPDLHQ